MAVTRIDPTQPVDSSSPTLGAADIRTLTGEVQQMFGGAGTAPVIYATAPFAVDTGTGLTTVPADPTASLGIATKHYVDTALLTSGTYSGVASGTNTYTVTLSPVPGSLAALTGLPVLVEFPNANTGASTLNPNGLGAASIVLASGSALTAGEIPANGWAILVFDGTHFELVTPIPYPFSFSSIPHGMQLFTSSGTFTVPSNVYSFVVEVWGAGGGGGGFGSGNSDGGAGGSSVVGSVATAGGGAGGSGSAAGSVALGGAGGTASVGTFQLAGGDGGSGGSSDSVDGGRGGSPARGAQSGASTPAYGTGGHGGSSLITFGAGGGGAGAYASAQVTTTPTTTYTVTLNNPGAAGTGGTQNGTAGIKGAALFTW